MSYIGEIKVQVKDSVIIKYVTYDYESRQLTVKLNSEASQNYLYVYEEVDAFTFFGFLGAHSAGKYYNEAIKNHDYKRVVDMSAIAAERAGNINVFASKLDKIIDMLDSVDDEARELLCNMQLKRTRNQ